jgi:hypothetical protein
MNTSLLRLGTVLFAINAGLAVAAVAADIPPSTATVATPSGQMLAIVNGRMTDGRPATLENVLEQLRPGYPGANIIMAGAETVVIRNLRMNWYPYSSSETRAPANRIAGGGGSPEMGTVLSALRAASGDKFTISHEGPATYIVSAIRAGETSAPARTVEVFNLRPYLWPARGQMTLHGEILNSERQQLETLRKNYAENHPEVKAQLERVATLQKSYDRDAADVERRVDEIVQLVDETVAELNPGKPGPKPLFRFHAGTNLLVVSGTREAVDITRKIVMALGGFDGAGGVPRGFPAEKESSSRDADVSPKEAEAADNPAPTPPAPPNR